jgi:hypothetical protein
MSRKAHPESGEDEENPDTPQPPTETVNLRIPSEQLARLDLLLADIRGQAGVFVGRSGAVRALANWLEEMNIGIEGILTGADLERRLTTLVSRSPKEPERAPGSNDKPPDGGGGGSPS